jgi:hypothetical protein
MVPGQEDIGCSSVNECLTCVRIWVQTRAKENSMFSHVCTLAQNQEPEVQLNLLSYLCLNNLDWKDRIFKSKNWFVSPAGFRSVHLAKSTLVV